MASGDSFQPTLPADEVRDRTILDDLSPSQAQRVLEAALQHYRMVDEREPGRPAVTASALLNGGLLPAASPNGKSPSHPARSLAHPHARTYCLSARSLTPATRPVAGNTEGACCSRMLTDIFASLQPVAATFCIVENGGTARGSPSMRQYRHHCGLSTLLGQGTSHSYVGMPALAQASTQLWANAALWPIPPTSCRHTWATPICLSTRPHSPPS